MDCAKCVYHCTQQLHCVALRGRLELNNAYCTITQSSISTRRGEGAIREQRSRELLPGHAPRLVCVDLGEQSFQRAVIALVGAVVPSYHGFEALPIDRASCTCGMHTSATGIVVRYGSAMNELGEYIRLVLPTQCVERKPDHLLCWCLFVCSWELSASV